MTVQNKNSMSFTKNPVFRYNADILAICLMLSVMGIHLNGIYALWQILICTAAAFFSELILFRLVIKKTTVYDLSAITTGMIIALLLPVSAPFYVGISAGIFAIAVAKLPFGDIKNCPFVPAAAGFCFSATMFPDAVFSYPDRSYAFSFFAREGFMTGETLFDMLTKGDSLSLNAFGRARLLSGAYPGAIGTTAVLTLIGAFIFLVIRHPKRFYSAAGYLTATAVFALIFPRINSGALSSVAAEICAGSLLFSSVLLITDPVTSPRKPSKAFIYGLLAGSIGMLLRYFSKAPDPSCFSILIVNALWPVISGETVLRKSASGKRKPAVQKTASEKEESVK